MAKQIQLIKVKLDPKANPPVTTDPGQLPVTQGNQPILWIPSGKNTFTFVAVNGLPYTPFSKLCVTDSVIAVQDNNTGTDPKVFSYVIFVTDGTNTYSTEPTSAQRNAPRSGVGGPASPTIKNN